MDRVEDRFCLLFLLWAGRYRLLVYGSGSPVRFLGGLRTKLMSLGMQRFILKVLALNPKP